MIVTLMITAVAIIRTGFNSWIGDVVRPVGLLLLAVLSLRGKTWARWTLIAWLGLSVIVFLASIVAAVDHPVVLSLFLGTTAVYIWAILELTLATVAASDSKPQKSRGSNAAT